MEFKFPDLGEGLVEGEIVKWHVKEGDYVKEGDPLVDVMTEKATVTLPAPAAGKVVKILAKEGQVVKVGQTLCVIEPAEGEAKQAERPQAEAAQQAPREVAAMPAARRLARELGVDLAKVKGTGPGGVITVEDVRRYAEELKAKGGEAPEAPKAAEAPKAVGGAEEAEVIPVRGIRRAVAEKMTKAKRLVPHAYHLEEVDLTELIRLRERLKAEAERRGVKLTLLPFVARAVALALREFPMLNSEYDEEKNAIVVRKAVNLGIAVDTEQGLVVVVVRDADRKGVLELAKEIAALAEKARSGKLDIQDVRGSTFTISNIGAVGGLGGLSILNYPEAAIMAVGQAKKKPWVVEGRIEIRDIALVAVSFDHRVVDGAYVARFVNRVRELLERPELLLL
ncbi:Pyruvate/2-oxoglutarate dehydrogenase complex, dihydrolipoamide acyltransferase (E2) component [Thermoproteus uzoniensis 768-20]|uniref:Pyruvate/2-oxoglutarate dehydrogenase complex, dihydrolipoamide acyltransferase (E2) component n=1 Tax=Thermoproteus uzoniensis (strain 768-20) TaxID=999630 RepID=F2L6B4_THEU7|nr:dihydrolipoamide acetyltransferase family protein [Thermoproteus uzoniensis]AEA12510.1 Pyruvate/2-oxoglutarate dehydrogenase complex, dihydrolipoamide acyltransferase (E2) component [Thermoproteus uzoniensis 768-20]